MTKATDKSSIADKEPNTSHSAAALPLRRRWIAPTYQLSGEPRRLLEAAIASPVWLALRSDVDLPAHAGQRRILDRVVAQYKLSGLTHIADCGEVAIRYRSWDRGLTDTTIYRAYGFEFRLVAEPRRLFVLDELGDFLFPVAVDEPDPEGLRAEHFLPGGLFELVRQHPAYVFGAVLTDEDLENSSGFPTAEDINAHDWSHAEARLQSEAQDLAYEAGVARHIARAV